MGTSRAKTSAGASKSAEMVLWADARLYFFWETRSRPSGQKRSNYSNMKSPTHLRARYRLILRRGRLNRIIIRLDFLDG